MRIAILDNYNDLAQTAADWSPLAGCELVFFNTHEADTTRLIEQLKPFEVLGVMRERTPPATQRVGAAAPPQNGDHHWQGQCRH